MIRSGPNGLMDYENEDDWQSAMKAANLPTSLAAIPAAPAPKPDAELRLSDYSTGADRGQKEFYDDPDMQRLRSLREDYAKGYNGEQLNALQGEANSQVQGQRANYLNQLHAQTAKAGIGGARAAAITAGADNNFVKTQGENQRKILLDSAKQKEQGANQLQDFLFRQKYGKIGSGIAEEQLGASDRGATANAAIANDPGKKKGFLGGLLDGLF